MDDHYIGDDMKLKQVILNILANAIKHTGPSGKITLKVSENGRTDSNAMAEFVIQDTGEGISPDKLPGLFEPFAREDEGNSFSETGLGLAITKNIVDMMGGRIDVVSEKGEGSVFTVTVPLRIVEGREEDIYSFDPKSHRALIVDDDITACEHARMVLKRIGIDSEYVLSGEEALSMFERLAHPTVPFNLLLVDWKMPGMDGIELTRRIRRETGGEDITIILTTYNWYEIMETALDAGVDAFIAKPMFASGIREEFGKIFAERRKNKRRTQKNASLEGRRVILAEDMELSSQIMRRLLEQNGILTDYAANGEEAVELFEKSDVGSYDAILMDIRMPKVDGLEATRRIRSLDRADAAAIPVIALTANTFDEDIRASLKAGMNAHLSKPIDPGELFSVMKSLII